MDSVKIVDQNTLTPEQSELLASLISMPQSLESLYNIHSFSDIFVYYCLNKLSDKNLIRYDGSLYFTPPVVAAKYRKGLL